jgi:hypothetical protein
MKRIWVYVLVICLFFFSLSHLLGCSKGKTQVEIVSKKLTSNPTNMAVIEVVLKNSGSAEAKVLLKATLYDEKGNVLEEPFEIVGPIKAGQSETFKIKSSTNFYKVKKFEVTAE